jgi:putative spermidine/putrescine transport system permease protein
MKRSSWNWLALPMILAFGTVFLPAIISFVLISFHPPAGIGRVGPEWTLDNYRRVLTDEVFLLGLSRSVQLGIVTVLGTLALGVPLTYFIARFPSRFAIFVFTLLYISSLTSIVIRGLGWITLLGTNGPINRSLLGIGLIDAPIQMQGNMLGLSIAMIHYMLPFMVLTLLPVMQSIPSNLEEASAGLGAGFARTARSVLVPLAMPGIIAGSLLVFAMTISAFVIPRMIGGATMRLTSLLIDQQMLTTFNYAIGSTLASILLALVIGVVILANLASRRRAPAS